MDANQYATARQRNRTGEQGYISHIGWDEEDRTATGPLVRLGYGAGRWDTLPRHGFRRAVWDFCLGYVSGFAVKDILYYILTRSLDARKSPYYKRRQQHIREHGSNNPRHQWIIRNRARA